FLLDNGAEVKSVNKNHKTLLHLASELGNKMLVKELIEKYNLDLNCCDDNEVTPLHLAAQNLHKDVIEYLLERNEKERKEIYKDENGDFDAEAYVNWPDNKGETALHKVFKNGKVDIEIAKLLVQNGADISLEDNEKRTPLHDADETTKSILMTETRYYMSRKEM